MRHFFVQLSYEQNHTGPLLKRRKRRYKPSSRMKKLYESKTGRKLVLLAHGK